MYKHLRNVSKRFQKDISSRTKDINSLVNCRCTRTHMHAWTWVNLELTPPEGGSAKNLTIQRFPNKNLVGNRILQTWALKMDECLSTDFRRWYQLFPQIFLQCTEGKVSHLPVPVLGLSPKSHKLRAPSREETVKVTLASPQLRPYYHSPISWQIAPWSEISESSVP